jgi:fatty-acyl-CoA synthase
MTPVTRGGDVNLAFEFRDLHGQGEDVIALATEASRRTAMWGTMMSCQLTLGSILERAGSLFADSEIVSRRPDRSLHRYSYGEFHRRARALAEALQKAGLRRGERVATLMFNHHVHLEAFFGVPAAGGVVHTVNPRLHPRDVGYILNHAEDKFLIVDDVFCHCLSRSGSRFRAIG